MDMESESVSSTVPYDHLLKILVIGDVGSDKRRLLQTYMGLEDYSDTTTLGETTPTHLAPYIHYLYCPFLHTLENCS